MTKKILIIIAVGLLLLGLFSCKSTKVPNRIYKKLATDAVPLDNDYKKNVMGQKCNVLFPIVPITIVKDSIRTKVVKVQDNNLVNKLKAQLAKGCPTLNIDSIYNELPADTIYIDHYHNTTTTVKDTTGNYFRQLNEDALRDTTNKYKAENTSLTKHIETITKDINESNNRGDKWKLYFFLLLSAGIIYKVAKIYLSKSFTLPKIF